MAKTIHVSVVLNDEQYDRLKRYVKTLNDDDHKRKGSTPNPFWTINSYVQTYANGGVDDLFEMLDDYNFE